MKKQQLVKGIAALGAAVVLASGCYNTKMMEFTYQELDTLKTQQAELMTKLDRLAAQFEAEREERLRTQAESAVALDELRLAVETLGYRIDDTAQRAGVPVPVGVRTAPDTLRSAADSRSPALTGNDGEDADRLFKGSYMDLTLGNYDLAVQGFKNFLARYPASPSLPGAHYYLGESYYALSRHLEAVAEYQSVIREYPSSRFTPPSYLKAGYCYNKLEEKQLAEKSFRDLISRYPQTEEAEQARVALQDLEG